MQIGSCKLCKRESQQLCDSHYLPKKVYGVMRAPQLKSPHPVALGENGVRQLSDQLRDYVFCKDCERCLNENGERWVLANIPQDYGAPFPLRTALETLTPVFVNKEIDLYNVAGVSAFETHKLVYFAMSMFWRGAIHEWQTPRGSKAPRIELCAYEEPIRRFLLGEQGLPLQVILTVGIWHAKKVLQAAHVPQPSHLAECQRYWFYVPGIIFSIYFGERVPADVLQRDATKNVVGVDVPEITSIWEITRSQIQARELGSKMKSMFNEIAAIRKTTSPN